MHGGWGGRVASDRGQLGAGGLSKALLEAVLSRVRREARRRQFPPKASSVLFNFELKCKQGSAPAAPTPNQIRCCDFSAGGGLPSGEGKLGEG